MDIESFEFSRSFLERLKGLVEEHGEGILDSLRFEVAEGPMGDTASLAYDDGRVGVVILNREDGSSTAFALKSDPD